MNTGQAIQTHGALEQIKAASAAGNPNACHELARYYDAQGNPDRAVRWMQRAIRVGHPPSELQLAVWLLLGHNLPYQPDKAVRMISNVAKNGDLFAQSLLASLYASGHGIKQSWDLAIDCLLDTAQKGLARAIIQVAVLLDKSFIKERLMLADLAAGTGDPTAMALIKRWQQRLPLEQAKNAFDWNDQQSWQRIKQGICLPHQNSCPAMVSKFTDPQINLIPALLSEDYCEYLCTSAEPYLKPATVNDAHSGELTDHTRTNAAMGFYPVELDVVVHSLNLVLSDAVRLPPTQGEVLSVLKYQPGETYAPHYDFFDPNFPMHAQEIKRNGQRIKTALIYLSDQYTAGETSFEQLNWKFKGQLGDALVFSNVDSSGQPDRQTLHSGLAPDTGMKYLASKWFRDSVR